MPEFKFTRKALQDLTDIWNYTFDTWSEKQADIYYKELLKECKVISKNPSIGKSYTRINNQLKGHQVNKHLIFYQVISNNDIKIIRILHERMDLKRRLKN